MANLGETDPLGTVPGRVSRAVTVLETVSDESFERLYFRLTKAAEGGSDRWRELADEIRRNPGDFLKGEGAVFSPSSEECKAIVQGREREWEEAASACRVRTNAEEVSLIARLFTYVFLVRQSTVDSVKQLNIFTGGSLVHRLRMWLFSRAANLVKDVLRFFGFTVCQRRATRAPQPAPRPAQSGGRGKGGYGRSRRSSRRSREGRGQPGVPQNVTQRSPGQVEALNKTYRTEIGKYWTLLFLRPVFERKRLFQSPAAIRP
uniref:Uncharacterized protein n=1 Tax=Chromera velia CCMP2878 TaxID=1169474 RepID=A0A0G4FTW9_9ALVE|eukprot:Cvel_18622.t1-p1 / transcript=Cvel_18622.t1 / gene=Cvel_18622 / organism=Chromera_velia_CCMP2878 / gene_product=hypothetical protein / transcript_product=hypothetical protein / location=Cvel_scaffold1554:34533-38922(-) / protein_length=260 / sequence_SO=supercontig / SO=protein_coding / is_pseudo=false